jgi:hypothetical protein
MALRQGRGYLLKQAFQKSKLHCPNCLASGKNSSKPAVWRIQDPTGLDMTAWTRVYDLGLAAIYVQTAGTLVRAAFTRNRRILARKAFIEKRDSEWTVDNDLGNPASLAQEYVAHRIVPEGAGCAVFGSSFRINRLAGNNRTEAALITLLPPTGLSKLIMDSETYFPNGQRVRELPTVWDDAWLRSRQPPQPPKCVPSMHGYCPPETE